MNETVVEKFVGIAVSKSTLDVYIEPAAQTLQRYDQSVRRTPEKGRETA